LREALALANDGDTINATGVSGTILLTSGALGITHSVHIHGPGSGRLAVNGNATSPVFENSASNVTISGFTITQANGGAIITSGGLTLSNSSVVSNSGSGITNNSGTLTITNCTVRGNSGGGITNNNGTLTITNCTVRGNSGSGIINTDSGAGTITQEHAMLTVNNCTVSGNIGAEVEVCVGDSKPQCFFVREGGGILNSVGGTAALTVSNCTISGNSADYGGGIYYEGLIGGTTVAISNSTLSGNSATDGGAIYSDTVHFGTASVSVKNCTISGNSVAPGGGGILVGGNTTLELGSTILNAGSSGQNLEIFNVVESLGYNLASDDGGGFLTGPGDQINANPMLGPLQHNGGPTLTQALLPGSPAINAGDPNFTPPPFFDQRGRGFARVVNGRIDIGSFEVQ